jgi:hypothetical protein
MGTENSATNPARVIDLSAATQAHDDALYGPLTNPGPKHPAAIALAQREKADVPKEMTDDASVPPGGEAYA